MLGGSLAPTNTKPLNYIGSAECIMHTICITSRCMPSVAHDYWRILASALLRFVSVAKCLSRGSLTLFASYDSAVACGCMSLYRKVPLCTAAAVLAQLYIKPFGEVL